MEKRLQRFLPGGKFKNVSKKRSLHMGSVRGTGNKSTERRLRFALVRASISGWKLRPRDLRGKPDFVFLRKRVAVFVDGCFWHGCPKCGHYPATNAEFWKVKIQRNRQRDRKTTALLQEYGFTVLRLWEHELKDDISNSVQRIREAVSS